MIYRSKKAKMITISQLVEREGSVAAATRFLFGKDELNKKYLTVYRWHTGESRPDDAHVRLLALKGVRP